MDMPMQATLDMPMQALDMPMQATFICMYCTYIYTCEWCVHAYTRVCASLHERERWKSKKCHEPQLWNSIVDLFLLCANLFL